MLSNSLGKSQSKAKRKIIEDEHFFIIINSNMNYTRDEIW